MNVVNFKNLHKNRDGMDYFELRDQLIDELCIKKHLIKNEQERNSFEICFSNLTLKDQAKLTALHVEKSNNGSSTYDFIAETEENPRPEYWIVEALKGKITADQLLEIFARVFVGYYSTARGKDDLDLVESFRQQYLENEYEHLNNIFGVEDEQQAIGGF